MSVYAHFKQFRPIFKTFILLEHIFESIGYCIAVVFIAFSAYTQIHINISTVETI